MPVLMAPSGDTEGKQTKPGGTGAGRRRGDRSARYWGSLTLEPASWEVGKKRSQTGCREAGMSLWSLPGRESFRHFLLVFGFSHLYDETRGLQKSQDLALTLQVSRFPFVDFSFFSFFCSLLHFN